METNTLYFTGLCDKRTKIVGKYADELATVIQVSSGHRLDENYRVCPGRE
jgi:hypothetical protein